MKKNDSEDGWQGFLELCSKIHSPKKLKKFLDLFLTIEEKETLASRFLVVKALTEGKLTQREIAEKCDVSISQITRGSNALKIIDADLSNFLKEEL